MLKQLFGRLRKRNVSSNTLLFSGTLLDLHIPSTRSLFSLGWADFFLESLFFEALFSVFWLDLLNIKAGISPPWSSPLSLFLLPPLVLALTPDWPSAFQSWSGNIRRAACTFPIMAPWHESSSGYSDSLVSMNPSDPCWDISLYNSLIACVQNLDNGSTVATSGIFVGNMVWTVSISSDPHVWAELWPYSCRLAAVYVLSSTCKPM